MTMPSSFDAVPCTGDQHLLGEGARWDARRGELLRVDILDGRVYRDRVADDGALIPVRTYQVPGTVGAVAPVEGDEGWLLAAGRGFAHLSPDGSLRALTEVTPAGTRMNDAACDPQGRFWAGTLADDHRAGGGALYRLERNGRIEMMLDGLTISNGLGWSPDGGTMYLADSGPRVVHAFAFDGERGTISDGRVLVEVPEEVGAPDGLTVDADGDLWVAIYGGGRVHRYSPDGVLRRRCSCRPWRPRPARSPARAEPALRHHRDRGLDRRGASRRARCRAHVPVRHRRDRPPGGAVPSRPGVVADGGRADERRRLPKPYSRSSSSRFFSSNSSGVIRPRSRRSASRLSAASSSSADTAWPGAAGTGGAARRRRPAARRGRRRPRARTRAWRRGAPS